MSAEAVPVHGETRKSHVLVVDDDLTIRGVVGRILNSAGFDVTTAASASEALGFLHTRSVDAIVSDIMMPHIDGLELLHLVRERDRDLPIILLTGQPSLDSAITAIKERSFRYVTKPFVPKELCVIVREAVSAYRIDLRRRRALERRVSGNWPTDEPPDLAAQFEIALEGLWMAFQPIVDWPNKGLFGYEALVRTTSSTITNPGLLFDAAERLGRVQELGRRIRCLVAQSAHRAPTDAAILVNLHSADLNDDDLFHPDSPLSKHADRVVLEVTERASLERVSDVQGAMSRLRKLGYRIAVDDLGAGYAGLSSFSQLEPEIVKLDMSLIREINASSRKASIVRSMISVCANELGTRVVCEGVETEAERETLTALGGDLLQGYLFAKPARAFPDVQW
jgi:EAL domain-containing protein (putative c-di-GMP-specific phosphodiesterase class I)